MLEGKKETVILTFGARNSLAKSAPMVQWAGEETETGFWEVMNIRLSGFEPRSLLVVESCFFRITTMYLGVLEGFEDATPVLRMTAFWSNPRF